MDECLDWQGRELRGTPIQLRGLMEKHSMIRKTRIVCTASNRIWLNANNVEEVRGKIDQAPVDITLRVGTGWTYCVQSDTAPSIQPGNSG